MTVRISKMKIPILKPLKNEEGFALILAISMLAIMSILGAMALNTASTETGISSNYRTSQIALSAAQRAVDYATTNGDIYTSLSDTYSLDATDNTNIEAGTGWGLQGTDNFVEFQMAANLPPGTGSDPTYFEARYYVINVTGEGPNNSIARIESQVGRIVPK